LFERAAYNKVLPFSPGINPLGLSADWFVGGLAGAPKAALRVGDYKLLTWGYAVKGIAGANKTGPLLAPPGTAGADPEFSKGPVLYDLANDEAETTNLARKPEHAALLRSMLDRLLELAEEQVDLGLGRIAALHHRSPTSHQIRYCNRWLYF
jgi:hypothetical protein